jgi:formylglycine-generating enzyme required for sulfatase activity
MIYENSTGGLVKSGATWAPATGKGNYPIINVTWYRANEFCKYYGGRLPTEAEWEFAARGGNSSKNYLYSGSNTVGDVAWYVGNASYTNTVGTKTANELGIYDMSGNVYEWCNDWYDVYLSSGQTNPTGASGGTYRVLRGGSWFNYNYSTCRASERDYSVPNNYNDSFGFRFVR